MAYYGQLSNVSTLEAATLQQVGGFTSQKIEQIKKTKPS